MIEYIRRRIAQAQEALGGKCIRCGGTEALQFDHIDPKTKSFTIASGGSFSKERFDEEVGKCQLLCFPCHNTKTLKETGRNPATHGALSMAINHRCKCDLCKKTRSDYNKQYHKTHARKRDRKDTPP